MFSPNSPGPTGSPAPAAKRSTLSWASRLTCRCPGPACASPTTPSSLTAIWPAGRLIVPRCWETLTETTSDLSSSHLTFSKEHDRPDPHFFIHGLAHVVDGQQGGANGGEGFHFHACAAQAGTALVARTPEGVTSVHGHVVQRKRVTRAGSTGRSVWPPGSRRSGLPSARFPWRPGRCGSTRLSRPPSRLCLLPRRRRCGRLPLTSTMRARPAASRCEGSGMSASDGVHQHVGAGGAGPRLHADRSGEGLGGSQLADAEAQIREQARADAAVAGEPQAVAARAVAPSPPSTTANLPAQVHPPDKAQLQGGGRRNRATSRASASPGRPRPRSSAERASAGPQSGVNAGQHLPHVASAGDSRIAQDRPRPG